MKVPSECPLRACSGLRLPVSKCTLLLGLQVLRVEIPLRVEEKEKRLRANAAESVCWGFAGVALEVPLVLVVSGLVLVAVVVTAFSDRCTGLEQSQLIA